MLVNFAKSYNLDIIQILFSGRKKAPGDIILFFSSLLSRTRGRLWAPRWCSISNWDRVRKASIQTLTQQCPLKNTILAYSPIWLPMNSRIPVLPDPPICPIEIILERAYLKNAKLDLLNLSFLFSVNGPFWERHLWRVNWTSSHLPDPPEGPKMENFNRRVSQSLACWMLNWKGLTLRRL